MTKTSEELTEDWLNNKLQAGSFWFVKTYAEKWNGESHEKYLLPLGSTFYECNMNKEVACCNCGRKIRYNETYTSRRIMTVTGFGYAECPECYFSYFREQIYGKNNR